MLKEEFRVHASYSGRTVFLFFPEAITLFSLALAVTSERLFAYTPLNDGILLLHLSVFLYGLSVGAFGFLGRQYLERRNGTRNYIVTMPGLLPMRLRKTFLGMYARDALFYVGLLLAPAIVGLALSVPVTHFRLTSIAILFGACLLDFLVGMSLSFFVSTLYMRSRAGFGATVFGVSALFVAAGVFHGIPISWILPGLGAHDQLPPFSGNPATAVAFVCLGLLVVGTLVATAAAMVPERYEPRAVVAQETLSRYATRFARLPKHGTLLAKEFVDMKRSGTYAKMFFSFVAPLLFLSCTAWFVRYGLQVPVGFNTVFYATMVGFFGVMLYNWLNNVDAMDCLATVPVTVPQVIRTKLLAFLLMTTWLTVSFVVGIGWLNDDTRLLWLAIPVALVTSVYMVTMTAYLTGLRTNSFLFNPGVLARFSALSMLPELGLTILSFTVDKDPLVSFTGIGLVLVFLGGATYFLLQGIEAKWRGHEFGE
jgi:MFS family permease